MFGSNDDKKAPAEAGEKKGLFSWFRKKPQQPVATGVPANEPPAVEQPAAAPVEGATAEAPQAPEPVQAPAAPQLTEPQQVAAPVQSPVVEAPVPEPVASQPLQAPEPEPVASQPLVAPAPQPVASMPLQAAPIEAAPVVEPAAPVSNLVLPVAEEPVALVPDLEPKAPPAIPERPAPEPVAPVAAAPVAVQAEQAKPGFFARLKQGLSKTSASIGEGMASLFLGKKVIDDDLLDEIETRLLTADVGVEATSTIVQNLTQKVARKQLADADALYKSLQEELAALLRPVEQPLVVQAQNKPYVILVVGVNGAGKTTTIGKLAKKLQLEGKKVMLAAGDTFRAAAVDPCTLR